MPESKKRCFVIMPFGKKGTPKYKQNLEMYQNLILPVAKNAGYEVKRADNFERLGNITRDIIEYLFLADLVIADLTDKNANVFYELGVRHALFRCGTIPLIQDDQQLPFDISNYRTIHYSTETDAGREFLKSELKECIAVFEHQQLGQPDNPVHDVLGNRILAKEEQEEVIQEREKFIRKNFVPQNGNTLSTGSKLQRDFEAITHQIDILLEKRNGLKKSLDKPNSSQMADRLKQMDDFNKLGIQIAALAQVKKRLEDELDDTAEKQKTEAVNHAGEPNKVSNKKADNKSSSFILPDFIRFSAYFHKVRETGQTVHVNPFEIAVFPVTNREYECFNPDHPRCMVSNQEDQPVVMVDWQEVKAYCQWLSQQTGQKYRLPSDAEWEYAATGGEERIFPWGEIIPSEEHANFVITGLKKTSIVGSFEKGKTPEGLYDMAGNICEWNGNWADARKKEILLRGGYFGSLRDNLTCYKRTKLLPTEKRNYIGFRLVRDLS